MSSKPSMYGIGVCKKHIDVTAPLSHTTIVFILTLDPDNIKMTTKTYLDFTQQCLYTRKL